MAIYRQTNKITSEEAAYIAGLIDGEGTISLSRKHRADNRQLVVSISNTERNLLNYVQETVGAGLITTKRTSRDNHTPSFTYSISNRQALDLLKQITPYLKSYKFGRATLVIDNYVRLTPRNGRYTSNQIEERESFIQQFFCLSSK
ncbi:MAG: LAGLIDADG family homing endonuclease [Nitrospirae bacterium]|nr:LAGLIDADG family homing endonuclease [Nitrospirota bacterium]